MAAVNPSAPAADSSPFAIRAGLIWTLVRTDFKVRYNGTAGGFVWALLKPLTMFVMLMAVFSFLFASDPNYKLNLIIGLFLWNFFADGTMAGLTSLHARGFLLTKARCPAWILVITSISNALITLAVFTVIIFAFLIWAGHPPSAGAMLLSWRTSLALALIVVGFSLGSSVLFLRYRDLNQVWDVMIQTGLLRRADHLSHWHPARAVSYLSVSLGADAHHRVFAGRAGHARVPHRHGASVSGAGGGGRPHGRRRRLPAVAAACGGIFVMSTVIEVDAVSKAFRIPTVRRETVREHVLGAFEPRRFERLQVLDRVSFTVERGEALGIMGRNGGGKSTLLKIICGVYPPDSGRVIRHAAITPVLELGVGWNPELDAIDNVCLIGSVMGLTLADIRRRMDRILAFAELERFANLKLKHYSSGMSSRLGYAVAFEAVREVLILDEIFAVGDAGFKAKCEERYRELHAAGHTIVLVSHAPPVVQGFCDRGILLEGGRVACDGSAPEAVDRYLRLLTGGTLPQSEQPDHQPAVT